MSSSTQTTYMIPVPQRTTGTAYGLWLLGIVGLCGVHRLYAGKTGSGLLWLFTFGLLGIGQFLDLFFIPGLVEDFNFRQKVLYGSQPLGPIGPAPTTLVLPARPLKGQPLMREILRMAQQQNGILTLSEACAALEADFDDIEAAFAELTRRGYASPENHLVTGAVEYHFAQLQKRPQDPEDLPG